MLKLWIEVVTGARAAGLSIRAKAVQLWEVGAGLPLDALKKGSIIEWTCPYYLEGPEIPPLLDALRRNTSLTHLDLTLSGLTWSGPGATGTPLLDAMNQSNAPLSALKVLVISPASRCRIPVGQLRRGGEEALIALRESPVFSSPARSTLNTPTSTPRFRLQALQASEAPRREEVLLIGDLLRLKTISALEEDTVRERIVQMRAAARNHKLRKELWERQLYQHLVEGRMRRGHLRSLICAEALRDVGFTAAELLINGFVLSELRDGGFSAAGLREAGMKADKLKQAGFMASELRGGGFHCRELRSIGFTSAELKEGGFVAKQLREIGVSGDELRANHFSAEELREGTYPLAELKKLFTPAELRVAGFTAADMKDGRFSLVELKAGDFSADDLRGAGYGCSEMRAAHFKIAELRLAGYSSAEMKIAGFSASEMKDDGFNAKKVRAAGFSAAEALEAQWTVEVLRAAGYAADELRKAKRSAIELKRAGYALTDLRQAGYPTQELQAIGYGAEELRAAGVSLSELAMAGATVAQLKAAGISVVGLKAEGMPLAELKAAGTFRTHTLEPHAGCHLPLSYSFRRLPTGLALPTPCAPLAPISARTASC